MMREHMWLDASYMDDPDQSILTYVG